MLAHGYVGGTVSEPVLMKPTDIILGAGMGKDRLPNDVRVARRHAPCMAARVVVSAALDKDGGVFVHFVHPVGVVCDAF